MLPFSLKERLEGRVKAGGRGCRTVDVPTASVFTPTRWCVARFGESVPLRFGVPLLSRGVFYSRRHWRGRTHRNQVECVCPALCGDNAKHLRKVLLKDCVDRLQGVYGIVTAAILTPDAQGQTLLK
jgi:hypothetical protein